MNKLNIFFSSIAITFLVACGGGGGGGSSTTIPDDSIPGFDEKDTVFISKGQKHFSYGQSATFTSSVSGTWSAKNGSIDSNGVYTTPSNGETTDTISFTADVANSNGVTTDSVDITLSTTNKFTKPHFIYESTSQVYKIDGIASDQAVGVAVFSTDQSTSESDLSITLTTGSSSKQSISVADTMAKLNKRMKTSGKYACHERSNYENAFKHSKKNSKKTSSKKSSKKSDANVGDQTQFFHDIGSAGFKNFELQYKGSKCLIYAEVVNGTAVSTVSKSTRLGDAFEVKNDYHPSGTPIFDAVTALVGNPWGIDENGQRINDGGRDDDEQVVILIFKGSSSLFGYFYWVDEEPAGFENPADGYISNGAEIVYLNSSIVDDEITIYSTLAHEFQHLCDYNQKFILDGNFTDENFFDASFDEAGPTLFNEGKSVLIEELNGFGMKITTNEGVFGNDFIFDNIDSYRALISTNTLSFLTWNGGSDYGKGYLFWRYLYDTYGEDTIKSITKSSKLPPTNMEEILGKSFSQLLQEFLIALMQVESSTKVDTTFKILSYDLDTIYFDTTGKQKGTLSPLGYLSGFPSNKIRKNDPWEIRLYKIIPKNGSVEFTIKNLSTKSSYGIFSTIVDK